MSGYPPDWLLELDIISFIDCFEMSIGIQDDLDRIRAVTALIAGAGDGKAMQKHLDELYPLDEETLEEQAELGRAAFSAAMNGSRRRAR